jgi:hypothetical protein
MWCDQLRRVSAFCGVEVLTYAVLDNHFHLLVRTPRARALPDGELVERYRALYPHRARLVEDVESTLAEGGTRAEQLRAKLLARMHDISMFLKELKQRFTKWFNARFRSYGTIWAERFKSLVVEDDASVLRTVGAYIDLNALRASLAKKPEEYRWCGMAAANRGDERAQAGIKAIARMEKWAEAWKAYKQFVYDAGLRQVKDKPHAVLNIEDVEGLIADKCLTIRQRSLSQGFFIGSREYISRQWQSLWGATG